MQPKLKEFLDELSKLTQKYEMAIAGCGCCGSPYIYDITTKKDLFERLCYDEEKQQYI